MHVHREDTVMILAGKDRGKKGRVIRLFPKAEKALVEKINMVKRHTRPSQQVPQGGIVEKEAPIHISNLQVVCSKCGKATRIGPQGPGGTARRPAFARSAAKFWIRKSKMTTTLLKEKYSKEVAPALMKKFEIKNVMQVPKVAESRHQRLRG